LGEFEEAGYSAVVASKAENMVPPCGAGSQNVEVDVPLTDVNVDDYDAVIVIGGNGCKSQWNDEETHQIIRDAVAHEKVLGAPGCASTILAHAGVLEGKEATVCTTDAAVKGGMDYNEVLESLGATCGRGIVRDGLIITAKARSLYFVAAVLETIETVTQ
jgi:protease I